MGPPPDPRLEKEWVATLFQLFRRRLGYEMPPRRMLREIVPFAASEAEAAGRADPSDLVDRVARGEDEDLWQRLVDLATVGETFFFRHPEQIEAVAAWCARLHGEKGRPLRIWSAGCASGEEIWTVAMRLHEAGVPHRLTATDVNRAVLDRARAGGPYSDRSVGHVPATYRDLWLEARGPGRWYVRGTTQDAPRVLGHNLVTEPPLHADVGPWDVILCRNVMIYFGAETTRTVLARLGGVLAPWGSLWLSPCDLLPTGGDRLAWEVEGEQRYLRRPSPPDAPPPSRIPRPAAAPRPGPAAGWEVELAVRLERGLFHGAGEIVDGRLAASPQDGLAWVARAALHLREHEFDATHAALDRAETAHPRPPGLAYVRGLTLLKQGRRDDALSAFLEALRDDPDDWASGWCAADLYRRRGKLLLEEALLRRNEALLTPETSYAPALGPAGRILEGVHREADAVRARTRNRLRQLHAAESEENVRR